MTNEDASPEARKPADELAATDPRYQRAARLLAQKLGVDWHTLPAKQVNEYVCKIEIAREK
jgi:hypothetical protein